jgi:TonB dependent receptor
VRFGLTWQQKNWDVGIFHKRVGSMYNDGTGNINYVINGITVPTPANQAVAINPFDLTNLCINYTIKNSSFLRGSKLGFSVNNLFDNHKCGRRDACDQRNGGRAVRAEFGGLAEFAARALRHGFAYDWLLAEKIVDRR